MSLKSSVVIFEALKPLQPQWPQQPQQPRWPQWPQQPHFTKKLPEPDGWIIPGTKITSAGPFLWDGSSKIQFFTGIWYLFCWRLLRPACVTFLKTGCKYQNFITLFNYRLEFCRFIIDLHPRVQILNASPAHFYYSLHRQWCPRERPLGKTPKGGLQGLRALSQPPFIWNPLL